MMSMKEAKTMSPSVRSKFPEDAKQSDAKDIPICVVLGDATLSMDMTGSWELENSALQEYISRVEALQKRNEQLETENNELKERCLRMTEESNMEKFKCQLLVEMLALSSLDEEKSREEAEKERVQRNSVKQDLLSVMEQARQQGVDIRKLTSVLPMP